MGNSVRLRALALVTAGILGSWSPGGVAVADPKSDHTDHGQHLGQTKDPAQGAGQGQGKDKSNKDKSNKDKSGKGKGQNGQGQDKGKHAGHAHAPGQVANPGHQGGQGQSQGQDHGQGQGQGHGPMHTPGNPPGNNGTVKIAGPGDEVGHPSNNPHPGCTFYVEWFGFDEGSDVVSTVTFASQAPTSDVVLGGTSPAQVFVDGDPAGGGTDLDGRQAYTLTFQGEPHPKQGYHVKLTVATPHSLGNDTKSKVFWVEPCASETAPETPAPGTEEDTAAGDTSDAGVGSGTVEGDEAAGTTDQGVLGETFVAGDEADDADAAVASGSAAVPTAVDAGENSALPEWARSPLPLTLISFVLVLAGAAIVLRNRSRA